MYKQYFSDALDRTIRFGLSVPHTKMTENRYINEQSVNDFKKVAQDFFGNCRPEEIALQCLQVNWNVLEEVSSFFDCSAYYTIGHIQDPKKCYFKNTEEELFQQISENVSKRAYNLHAWITLDSYEIIDLTFATSWGVVNNNMETIGGLTLTHPEDLKKGREYVPMLVGEDYLFAVGAIALELIENEAK